MKNLRVNCDISRAVDRLFSCGHLAIFSTPQKFFYRFVSTKLNEYLLFYVVDNTKFAKYVIAFTVT